MNIFSKIQDWATGNSINFETEAKVYAEITEAMQNLAEKLEIAINNNRIESEALIQQKCFEISLIQAEMNNILKNSIGMDLNEKNK